MCGFIAQLVEHRTGIAEVTGSNPVEALIFFRILHSNCLNWKFTAKTTYHLHIYPQFIYESFHILHVTSNNTMTFLFKSFKDITAFPLPVLLNFYQLQLNYNVQILGNYRIKILRITTVVDKKNNNK